MSYPRRGVSSQFSGIFDFLNTPAVKTAADVVRGVLRPTPQLTVVPRPQPGLMDSVAPMLPYLAIGGVALFLLMRKR